MNSEENHKAPNSGNEESARNIENVSDCENDKERDIEILQDDFQRKNLKIRTSLPTIIIRKNVRGKRSMEKDKADLIRDFKSCVVDVHNGVDSEDTAKCKHCLNFQKFAKKKAKKRLSEYEFEVVKVEPDCFQTYPATKEQYDVKTSNEIKNIPGSVGFSEVKDSSVFANEKRKRLRGRPSKNHNRIRSHLNLKRNKKEPRQKKSSKTPPEAFNEKSVATESEDPDSVPKLTELYNTLRQELPNYLDDHGEPKSKSEEFGNTSTASYDLSPVLNSPINFPVSPANMEEKPTNSDLRSNPDGDRIGDRIAGEPSNDGTNRNCQSGTGTVNPNSFHPPTQNICYLEPQLTLCKEPSNAEFEMVHTKQTSVSEATDSANSDSISDVNGLGSNDLKGQIFEKYSEEHLRITDEHKSKSAVENPTCGPHETPVQTSYVRLLLMNPGMLQETMNSSSASVNDPKHGFFENNYQNCYMTTGKSWTEQPLQVIENIDQDVLPHKIINDGNPQVFPAPATSITTSESHVLGIGKQNLGNTVNVDSNAQTDDNLINRNTVTQYPSDDLSQTKLQDINCPEMTFIIPHMVPNNDNAPAVPRVQNFEFEAASNTDSSSAVINSSWGYLSKLPENSLGTCWINKSKVVASSDSINSAPIVKTTRNLCEVLDKPVLQNSISSPSRQEMLGTKPVYLDSGSEDISENIAGDEPSNKRPRKQPTDKDHLHKSKNLRKDCINVESHKTLKGTFRMSCTPRILQRRRIIPGVCPCTIITEKSTRKRARKQKPNFVELHEEYRNDDSQEQLKPKQSLESKASDFPDSSALKINKPSDHYYSDEYPVGIADNNPGTNYKFETNVNKFSHAIGESSENLTQEDPPNRKRKLVEAACTDLHRVDAPLPVQLHENLAQDNTFPNKNQKLEKTDADFLKVDELRNENRNLSSVLQKSPLKASDSSCLDLRDDDNIVEQCRNAQEDLLSHKQKSKEITNLNPNIGLQDNDEVAQFPRWNLRERKPKAINLVSGDTKSSNSTDKTLKMNPRLRKRKSGKKTQKRKISKEENKVLQDKLDKSYFSSHAKSILVELISKKRNILERNPLVKVKKAEKQEAWKAVMEEFNATVGDESRTVDELKTAYYNLKCCAKRKFEKLKMGIQDVTSVKPFKLEYAEWQYIILHFPNSPELLTNIEACLEVNTQEKDSDKIVVSDLLSENYEQHSPAVENSPSENLEKNLPVFKNLEEHFSLSEAADGNCTEKKWEDLETQQDHPEYDSLVQNLDEETVSVDGNYDENGVDENLIAVEETFDTENVEKHPVAEINQKDHSTSETEDQFSSSIDTEESLKKQRKRQGIDLLDSLRQEANSENVPETLKKQELNLISVAINSVHLDSISLNESSIDLRSAVPGVIGPANSDSIFSVKELNNSNNLEGGFSEKKVDKILNNPTLECLISWQDMLDKKLVHFDSGINENMAAPNIVNHFAQVNSGKTLDIDQMHSDIFAIVVTPENGDLNQENQGNNPYEKEMQVDLISQNFTTGPFIKILEKNENDTVEKKDYVNTLSESNDFLWIEQEHDYFDSQKHSEQQKDEENGEENSQVEENRVHHKGSMGNHPNENATGKFEEGLRADEETPKNFEGSSKNDNEENSRKNENRHSETEKNYEKNEDENLGRKLWSFHTGENLEENNKENPNFNDEEKLENDEENLEDTQNIVKNLEKNSAQRKDQRLGEKHEKTSKAKNSVEHYQENIEKNPIDNQEESFNNNEQTPEDSAKVPEQYSEEEENYISENKNADLKENTSGEAQPHVQVNTWDSIIEKAIAEAGLSKAEQSRKSYQQQEAGDEIELAETVDETSPKNVPIIIISDDEEESLASTSDDKKPIELPLSTREIMQKLKELTEIQRELIDIKELETTLSVRRKGLRERKMELLKILKL